MSGEFTTWGEHEVESEQTATPLVIGMPAKRQVDESEGAQRKCAYCMCNLPNCLVRCRASGRWFCNGKGSVGHSHIIHHLVKTQSGEIDLPEENQYAKVPLTCHRCRTENIFMLGFVQSLKLEKFYILCRSCMREPEFNGLDLDRENFAGIVTQEHDILDWFVTPPTEEETRQFLARSIKGSDMDLLEDAWSENKQVSIRDLPMLKQERRITPTKLSYTSAEEYQDIMSKLVTEEMRAAKMECESLAMTGRDVFWEPISGMMYRAKFDAPSSKHARDINVGDEVTLSSDDIEARGIVSKAGPGTRFEVKVKGLIDCPPSSMKFTIKPKFNETSFEREQTALTRFTFSDTRVVNPVIRQLWLGNIQKTIHVNEVDHVTTDFPGFKRNLNFSQHGALVKALGRSFTLIQGPPGTGKTTTIAAYVYKALKHCTRSKILVCCPSNVAVEHVTHYISQTSVNVVRFVATSMDDIDSIVNKSTVNKIIFEMNSKDSKRLKQLKEQSEESVLSKNEKMEYDKLRERLEKLVCEAADVVCCTASTSGCKTLSKMHFSRVVIDEAGQAVEPDLLIPITHGCEHLVLVGDHRQLGPTILSSRATKAGYGMTILQRLVSLGMRPLRLTVQYRMHPVISEFPSNFFYDGSLTNGVSPLDRTPEGRAVFPWPRSDMPMFFYNAANGEDERASFEKTYVNKVEAALVIDVVTMLCKAGVNPIRIGVITPYAGQRHYIKQTLGMAADLPCEAGDSIDVESVDAFQGAERDYIILSCVRSNAGGHIGFLNDQRRGCVAITRAKMGLIIIGRAETLTGDPMWYSLLNHFQANELLVDGDLRNLKPSAVILEQHKKVPKRRS